MMVRVVIRWSLNSHFTMKYAPTKPMSQHVEYQRMPQDPI